MSHGDKEKRQENKWVRRSIATFHPMNQRTFIICCNSEYGKFAVSWEENKQEIASIFKQK